MEEKIVAVVVTYNRKDLLIECIKSIIDQQYPVIKIIVIDNASTDDTEILLKEYGFLENSAIEYKKLIKNIGGAGGFSEGIKKAYTYNADWIWLMDDDTECNKDTLSNLVKATYNMPLTIGFVCSKVLWTDGKVHLMNMPATPNIVNGIPFNEYDSESKYIVSAASFVSCLINTKAIKEVGLPIKEMFIWSDDIEYTHRITSNGYIGIYARKSTVLHKTKENYYSNIVIDSSKNLWKYKFGIRNDIYTKKVYSGIIRTFIILIFRLTIINYRIIRHRKGGKFIALYINTKSSISGLLFNPKIDHAN